MRASSQQTVKQDVQTICMQGTNSQMSSYSRNRLKQRPHFVCDCLLNILLGWGSHWSLSSPWTWVTLLNRRMHFLLIQFQKLRWKHTKDTNKYHANWHRVGLKSFIFLGYRAKWKRNGIKLHTRGSLNSFALQVHWSADQQKSWNLFLHLQEYSFLNHLRIFLQLNQFWYQKEDFYVRWTQNPSKFEPSKLKYEELVGARGLRWVAHKNWCSIRRHHLKCQFDVDYFRWRRGKVQWAHCNLKYFTPYHVNLKSNSAKF